MYKKIDLTRFLFISLHLFFRRLAFPMFALFLDIFQTPMWKDFQDSIPPHLLGLADEVKQTLFLARADGSVRTYLGGFNSWECWAKSNGLPYLLTNSFHVAMSLQVILQSASSASPINRAVYSIDWALGLAGCPKVFSHCMVQSVMSASKRLLAKPKCRKEPISP